MSRKTRQVDKWMVGRNITVPRELDERVVAAASSLECSVAALYRKAIRRFLDEYAPALAELNSGEPEPDEGPDESG